MTVEEALELGQFYCRNLANHKQGAEAAATLARWKPFILAAQKMAALFEPPNRSLPPPGEPTGPEIQAEFMEAYRAAVSQETK